MAFMAVQSERYPFKVGAEFADESTALWAVDRVVDRERLDDAQIRLLRPDDPNAGVKLEPESGGIARTLVKSHIVLGAIGLLTALVAAIALVLGGVQPFAASPLFTVLVAGFFGAIAGLLLGGLVSLRPDHDRLIARARAAIRHRHFYLVVHTRDHDQERRVKDLLHDMSSDVTATF